VTDLLPERWGKREAAKLKRTRWLRKKLRRTTMPPLGVGPGGLGLADSGGGQFPVETEWTRRAVAGRRHKHFIHKMQGARYEPTKMATR
jgi:hypothetical protein